MKEHKETKVYDCELWSVLALDYATSPLLSSARARASDRGAAVQ